MHTVFTFLCILVIWCGSHFASDFPSQYKLDENFALFSTIKVCHLIFHRTWQLCCRGMCKSLFRYDDQKRNSQKNYRIRNVMKILSGQLYLYPSGLLHWPWYPKPIKQLRRVWVNNSHEPSKTIVWPQWYTILHRETYFDIVSSLLTPPHNR